MLVTSESLGLEELLGNDTSQFFLNEILRCFDPSRPRGM